MTTKEEGLLSPHAKERELDFSQVSTPLPKGSEVLQFGIAEGKSSFFTTTEDNWEENASKEIEKAVVENLGKTEPDYEYSGLVEVVPVIRDGVEAIVKDSFTDCFRPRKPRAWNWNPFLFAAWSCGVFVRYFILLPIRLIILFLGTIVFSFFLILFSLLPPYLNVKQTLLRKLVQYYGGVWFWALCAVVKYHGTPPVRRPNQIYVSNHTSLLDFVILSWHLGVATVGQKHGGAVGFMQNYVVAPLGNIWFERFEVRDRTLAAKRIKAHISNAQNPPLLIFPEGVCVNNEYCVLFKKGVFDIEGVEICPVAMKYNKLFSDPYWSSKDESFLTHVLRIMKSWCLVCDVYFLESETKQPIEDSIAFASRVQETIAKRAGITNLQWDGYLKYYKPSATLLKAQQKLYADRLKKKWGKLIDFDKKDTTPADEPKKER